MNWRCIADRSRLVAEVGGLRCSVCARAYPVEAGIALIAASASAPSSARLEELWRDVERCGAVEAARVFCERNGCERTPWGVDWKFLMPESPGGTLLQMGAGFGDDARFLAGMSPVIAAVHHPIAARIVARHLSEARARDIETIVIGDAARLPLEDGSLAKVALEHAAMSAFGVTPATFDAVAAELARVVVPGGVVLLGLRNPWHARLGLDRARGLMPGGRTRVPLDELLARESAPRAPRPSWARVRRSMVRHGFAQEAAYAPLPDERRPEIVVPVDDARIVRYCLDNLIRKNSPFVRAAIGGAGLLARVGRFQLAVPYGFFYFRRRAVATRAQAVTS